MDHERFVKIRELEKHSEESSIAVPTPQKKNEPLRKEVKLSENFETIVEFFNCMNCSLRLLGLRKKLATFENVSAQVEVMMKRKFMYSHLAQIKYILPEAIQIDKIFVQDRKTSFMKPEMKVTLLVDAVEKNSGQSSDIALQELFVSQLVDFLNVHPEACDIPEAMLPELFDRSSHALSEGDTSGESTIHSNSYEACDISEALLPEQFDRSTRAFSEEDNSGETLQHQWTPFEAGSIRRHFSLLTKSVSRPSTHCDLNKIEVKSCLGKDVDRVSSSSDGVKGLNVSYEQEKDTNSYVVRDLNISCEQEEDALHGCSKSATSIQTPVVKSTSSNGNLMVETPAQLMLGRPDSPTSEKNSKCTGNNNCISSCLKPAKRSLNFSGLEDDEIHLSSPCKDNSMDVQDQNQQTPKTLEESTFYPLVTLNKEIISHVEDEELNSIKLGMCKQQSSCLPDIVSNICSIFRTVGYSSITKDELVHKIIINNFDIVERKEVEEKVELLEKLVPDWICRKKMLSGDTMYSIKKVSDMESIILRLSN